MVWNKVRVSVVDVRVCDIWCEEGCTHIELVWGERGEDGCSRGGIDRQREVRAITSI